MPITSTFASARFVFAVLVAGAASVALLSCSDASETPAAPAGATARPVHGVLLVVCDTLRADHLDPYGGTVGTPNVKRLAERGVRFDENHSQGSWTLPSMLSLMTGRWVPEHSAGVPQLQPTLAELFSEAGFATAAFVANPVCSAKRGFARGFDVFEPFTEQAPATDLAHAFEGWLTDHRASSSAPWFAWVHAMDPHVPYEPDPRYLDTEPPEPSASDLYVWNAIAKRLSSDQPDFMDHKFDQSVDFMRRYRGAYRGEVRAFDAGLGQILDALAASGELESTLIVFAADHGEMLWEYPAYQGFLDVEYRKRRQTIGVQGLTINGHSNWYYPQIWRTPLIVSGPGFPPGTVGSGLSANIDIAPTLLAAAGIEAPRDLEGQSLIGHTNVARPLVFASGQGSRAVLDTSGTYWVELPRKLSGVNDEELPSGFLFELGSSSKVPGDRSSKRPEDVARLRAALDAWAAAASFKPNQAIDASEDQVLIDLGYVEAPGAEDNEEEK